MPGRTINNIGAESSRKRSRLVPPHDSDDDDIIDVRQASSSLRGDSSKRVRLSNDESNKGGHRFGRHSTPDTSDDAEEPSNGGGEPNSPESPAKTQYELMRDGNFEHLQHQAADDQRATQRLRFRPNLLGDNAIADNGIIESITCVNFMCHQRLHCELGPLLNFIVGENGSGKSAILTAITLCLGGKASSTNRGGSLKSFVKEGCERGFLSVKIKNQGQDAYRHDVYGDSIVVERHFSKTGSSGFKVKTYMGQIISTKKQEVDEIVEYYALQVDNPLNVLSQDNARQFLNASTKTQKYKFFIEGVQLQQLDNDYRLISESLEQMVAKVPDQEERVKHAKADLEKANQLKEAFEGNRKTRVKYRTVRRQMVWAQVEEQEKELERRDDVLKAARTRVADAERLVREKQQAFEIASDKVTGSEEAVQNIREEEGEKAKLVEEADDVFKKLRKELEHLHHEEREAHQQLKAASDSIADLKKKIDAEAKRLEDANGEAHTLKENELKEAMAKIENLTKEISDNKTRELTLKNGVDDAKKALGAISDELQRKKEEISAAQVNIQQLQEKQNTLYSGYEPKVPDLVRMIGRDNSFENKPIGPLGAHIQLLKPEWSSILEKTLGGNLNAFLVTSKRDQKTLQEMISRFQIRNCPVLIGSRHPINLNGKEPDESFDTILRVLKFDNNMVRDQLIINNMIEQVILIPERLRAEEIMFNGAAPRNVKACLSFHEKKRGEGLRLTRNDASGSISTSPIVPNYSQRPRMKTDSDSQISYRQELLKQMEVEYRAIDSEKRRNQQEAQRCQAELMSLAKERKSLETQLRHARVLAERLESDLDQFDGADGRLRGLQEQLKELEASEHHHGLQYGTLELRRKEKNAVVEKASKELKEAKLKMKDFEARLEKELSKLKRLGDSRRIELTETNEACSSLEITKEELEQAEGKRERQNKHVLEFTEQAEAGFSPRTPIPDNETHLTLKKTYEALGKRLEEQEKKTGMTEEEVNVNLARAKEAYNKVVDDLHSIKAVNTGLRDTLNLRLEKWRKFQRYISSQSRANFIYLLSERGFRGKLLLDHERKALDLQVEPDRTEKRAAGRNTKTLSGGEKSFSSICLLLSIWEAMGSPLRCLDEFDVFMDNVNRAISTNMLITAARRSVNRQYIFITPNAIEGRNTLDRDVKIIRLTDPRQRTLADH
ncbi:P-loop containing nucleoside triphosphate hydrolase protein [Podospora didyma]|uniref:P-loop containing nucleoside triphosphate hydrolase protein n=1 Tax=Podospora didyma TaxID=330526 RepID=A0AAE0NNF1_9PEZI|nr:P-loop containing nucleoside triphosphate hydrolase protein [Podospora didyma]